MPSWKSSLLTRNMQPWHRIQVDTLKSIGWLLKIDFLRSGIQRKTMTVYWIYKDKENQVPSSPRIFFLYDPVTNLRTAMGPETGEPANQRPASKSRDQSLPIRGKKWSDRGRRRNIQSFKETLDRLSGNMSKWDKSIYLKKTKYLTFELFQKLCLLGVQSLDRRHLETSPVRACEGQNHAKPSWNWFGNVLRWKLVVNVFGDSPGLTHILKKNKHVEKRFNVVFLILFQNWFV